MASNRPQFWLQVRKDYIFDNFDNLLNYLRQYNYVPNEEHPDYDSTLSCMTELSEEIADKIFITPFYESLDTGYDSVAVIRLFCATILASNKARITPHRLIASLVDIVAKCGIEMRDFELDRFYRIVCDCIRGKEMIKCGFTWDDIVAPRLQFGLFIVKFCQMAFHELPDDAPAAYIENRGLFVIPRAGEAELAVVNRVNFEKMKPETQFTLPGMVKVVVSKRELENAADFERLYKITSRLLSAQDQMKPSTRRVLNNYDFEDEFIVKVVSKRGVRIEAETIDPDYTRMRGKVLLWADEKRPVPATFSSVIKEGDYLRVCSSENPDYAFEIQFPFENFYRTHASASADMTLYARYSSSYSKGTEWITQDGIRVGIDNGKLNALDAEERALFDSICAEHGVIELRLYKRPPRTDGDQFFVYGEIENLNVPEEEENFYFTDADRELVTLFLEDCLEEGREVEGKGRCLQFEAADRELCIPLVSVMARFIEGGLSSCRSRLEYITATAMLCKVLDLQRELAYMDHERRYLYAQVQFAQNKDFPALTHAPVLDGSEDVARREKIIDTLRSYRKKDVARGVSEFKPKGETLSDQVSTLVNASNSLIDIIDTLELNNIKQAIARALSIEDEYVSILDERTFYGMESISLEFKTSVVFPPTNRRRMASVVADPDMQKWAIVKAVCGFLNSRSGGELLIGVGDDGYARGLEDDMRELTDLRYIPSPTLDHYRTYVQYILDRAFCVAGNDSKISPTDISRLCIKYVPEQNAEGKEIMRIQIRPYQGEIVSIVPERPDWMEESYVRLSGRTVPVTSAMTGEIMKYKEID